jgi:hypothetical protein
MRNVDISEDADPCPGPLERGTAGAEQKVGSTQAIYLKGLIETKGA